MEWLDTIQPGDCLDVLAAWPAECVDLIVTSPPYADQRQDVYGGLHPDRYVEWFLPRAAELQRVLRPTGSFVLNIKERVVGGERHTYVLELILALRRQGWLWTEEYLWHKKNSHPGKWPNRFRDNWERLLHFTRQKQFKMFQDAVMVPVGEWAQARLKTLSATDRVRDNSRVGSGFGKNVSHWVGRRKVYPNNVLHLATECSNQGHAASFPLALPEWFVKLFTAPGDVVLDPFCGAGTTCLAAQSLGRRWVGIDSDDRFVTLARERLKQPGQGQSES
jgi:DNA modification methylase